MVYQWTLTPFAETEVNQAISLAQEVGLSPVVAFLLVHRGITSHEAVQEFFHPKLNQLHNPFLMNDMDRAVNRLNKALGRREKILVFGDYDVDGTTAVSLVYKYLRHVGCSDHDLEYYIPNRDDDGYGVTFSSIDYAHSRGVKLIIILDCGIKAVEEVAYAKTLGIDFIICDHHNQGDQLPDAVAVLNPKRLDNQYPNTELSGCGVGFKFMQAFAKNNGFSQKKLFELLDLLAVSIASDIVSVAGENRTLAFHGLKQINKKPSLGIKEIIKVCGLTKKRIDMSDIVLRIGPRLNACGRMEQGNESVSLLLSTDSHCATEQGKLVDSFNNLRRIKDKEATDDALAMIKANSELSAHNIIVLYGPEWHKGVVGIVASRIAERYGCPAIIFSGDDDAGIAGSARSYAGFDLYSAVESCQDLLLNFGGHTFAVGLTIAKERVDEFRRRITEYTLDRYKENTQISELDIAAAIQLNDINRLLMRDLKRLAPYGPGNERPLFMSVGVVDTGASRVVGQGGAHIRLELADPRFPRKRFSGFAFGLGYKANMVKGGMPFDIAYYIEESTLHGAKVLQLVVKDIRLSKS